MDGAILERLGSRHRTCDDVRGAYPAACMGRPRRCRLRPCRRELEVVAVPLRFWGEHDVELDLLTRVQHDRAQELHAGELDRPALPALLGDGDDDAEMKGAGHHHLAKDDVVAEELLMTQADREHVMDHGTWQAHSRSGELPAA